MAQTLAKNLKKSYMHPFHIVDQSPWPLMAAISTLIMVTGLLKMFQSNSIYLLLMGVSLLLMTTFQWTRDMVREATLQGKHTKAVTKGLKLGMALFIISELFFFISFFWAFLHSSLAPTHEIGMSWPPKSILPFNPLQIPLLNTTLLLASGISCTWAHNAIIKGKNNQILQSLKVTIFLGITFTILQGWEYMEAPFTMADSVYGSTFFMATGFHGIHVIIGTIFLSVSLLRASLLHYSKNKHFGFEAAAWYWHFVDVIWLILYLLIYWWGG